MEKNASRLAFLDFLRIFSFVSVLIGHKFYVQLSQLAETDYLHQSLRTLIKGILPFCVGGGAGVVVFFLVSGYVITFVLEVEKPNEFIIKRIFRIYPLYMFAVLIQTILLAKIQHVHTKMSVLIPQLLLVGNFFNTPYSLNGVEWTLRIEVFFYIFMYLMSHFKILNDKKPFYPWILVFMTLLLGLLPAMPSEITKAYINLYTPFLFLGSFFFLYEKKRVNLQFLIGFCCLIFIQHWQLISYHQPAWRIYNFAIYAFFIFLALWSMKKHVTNTALTLLISELTYSVYLFHNWLFDYIKDLNIFGLSFHKSKYALGLLLLICFFMTKFVEKPGIKMGRKLLRRTNKTSFNQDSLDYRPS
ncbi:MAG: acyltransferase family protein [Proteobacteria bacterium]|nr:acyltransferase family protein [Pseudomonadota bacterium]